MIVWCDTYYAYICAVTNAAVNPFACTIQLTPFRKALGAIFRRNPPSTRVEMNVNARSCTLLSYDTGKTSSVEQNSDTEEQKTFTDEIRQAPHDIDW